MRPNKVLSWQISKNTATFKYENFTLNFQTFSERIINIFASKGENKSFTQAVVMKPEEAAFDMEESKDYIILSTGLVKVRIGLEQDFAMEFIDNKGFLLQTIGIDLSNKNRSCSFKIRKDEHFYGLGEKTGFLDKRGRRYTMWNTDHYEDHDEGADCLYESYPFYMGLNRTGCYGIYLDNTYKTFFDVGKQDKDTVTFGAEKGPLNFFFIYGPSMKEVVLGYTKITGRIELPPLWALGYHQSRYSYVPQEKVLEIARTFREKDIPCDVIYLDIDYMDGYRVFTFDKEKFPDPAGMIKELEKMGFKVVTILDPGLKVDGDYGPFKEGLKKNYFVTDKNGLPFTGRVWPGLTCFPDFSRDDVKSWWAGLHEEYMNMGIAGIWNDMNEPAVMDSSTKTMPVDLVHDRNGNPTTHEEFHNIYALNMAMATKEAFKKFRPCNRPFILTRAAFSGIQRYSAMWTGDNRSYWNHLKTSIPMLLNIGLSGEPFCGADIGGFTGDCSEELFIRWIQTGVFYPFCRNHSGASTADQEPWAFGARCEQIAREFIKLRYKLLPYIYNLFYQAASSGDPVLRPLVYEYEEDENCHAVFDEFLLGESILGAPVVEPGKTNRAVYLPDGRWIDWWSGKEHEGGRYILADAPLDKMPLYVKAGSIIPMREPMSHTGEKPLEAEFHIFPGNTTEEIRGEYVYYEDDGRSEDYKKGAYNLYKIRYTMSKDVVDIKFEKTHSGYDLGQKDFKAVIRGEKIPDTVLINGRKSGFNKENENMVIDFC